MEKIDDNSCKHCDFIGSIFGPLLDSDPYSEGTVPVQALQKQQKIPVAQQLYCLYCTVQ